MKYFAQTASILIINDFSSILRGEHNVIEHIDFVCDKLCAFCAIFFSFRFTIGLNTFIVSRLEFFGITFDAHPHSGWFFCLAPNGARRTNSHIIQNIAPSGAIFLFFLFRWCMDGNLHFKDCSLGFIIFNSNGSFKRIYNLLGQR